MTLRRGRRRRAVALAVAAVLAVLLLLGGISVLTTSARFQRLAYLRGPRAVAVPAWTRPCWRHGDQWTLPCAIVHGRIIYRQLHDPDGEGDRHVVVIAGPRVLIIKFPAGAGPASLPSVGSSIAAAGTYQPHGGRLGLGLVTARGLLAS